MTYLAIARKYRPATFDEIVGQEHVTRTLRNAIRGDRIHHAYLFTGARGVGKTTAARALARALNCEQGPTDEPCGTCTSCTEIATGTSPDLIEIDGASNNSVEDVREIREAVQYAPTRGKFKIYLVDEVHMLSRGAFNALLKTLEEPPPHVVFVFATTEPNKIPDTILSRVQRFDFKRIPVPKVVERLSEIATAEGVSVGAQGLRMIAQAGEGSMRDAQSLLDQVISASAGTGEIPDALVTETLGLVDRELLHSFVAGLVRGEPSECFTVIDRVYAWGHELSTFTEELLEVVRDATFLGLSPQAARFVDLPTEEAETLAGLVQGVPAERLSRLFDALVDVHGQVKHAARPRIVLEMAVARLATTRPAQPVGELLGRLELLERNLRSSGTGRSGGPSSSGRGPAGPSARGPTGGRADARGGPPGPPPRGSETSRASKGPKASIATSQKPGPAPQAQAEQRAPVRKPLPPHPTELPEPPPMADDHLDSLAGSGGWDSLEMASTGLGQLATSAPRSKVTRRIATRTTDRASKPAPDSPWGRFCAALEPAGDRFAVFTRAAHLEEGDRLRLIVPAGRPLAEANRLKGDPLIAQALQASYPPGTTIALEASRSGRIDRAQLEREFLADPSLRRIVQTLGATVERVEPLLPEE